MTTRADAGYRGWSAAGGAPTALVWIRHGATAMTAEKRFSGGLGGSNPGLSAEGRAQVEATAAWVAEHYPDATAIVTSPVRRTVESAALVAAATGLPVAELPGLAEMEFGAWDGLTFGEVMAQDPDGLRRWLGSTDVSPGRTGESFAAVRERVDAALDELRAAYAGGSVLLVSHVTPIKTAVAAAVGAPLDALYRMELVPSSVTETAWWPDPDGPPRGSLRLFNHAPWRDVRPR